MAVALYRERARREAIGLLPEGLAWAPDPGTVLFRLLEGLGYGSAEVDSRIDDLARELDPRTTTELLPDWERVVGLPDDCLPEPQSTAERRALVVSRLVGVGGGSRRFFIDLAESIGFEITIEEGTDDLFKAGASAAGDSLGGPGFFVWYVDAPPTTGTSFQAGRSRAGDPLRTWGNALLECVIRRDAPAHTLVVFRYGEVCWLVLFDENGDPINFNVGGSGDLEIRDELGRALRVDVVNKTITFLDENGDPVTIHLTGP